MAVWTLDGRYDFEGREIRYGMHGPAGAAPIVLLHGTPFSSSVWRRLVPWLAQRVRVHFHDMLGYGQSAMVDGDDVSLGVQNRVLTALLETWGLERPHVVAHDFGGATALRSHLLDGRDYASLTLIDAVALRPWGSPFVSHVNKHEAAFAGMPAYAHQALLPAYLRTAVNRPITDAALEPYAAPWHGSVGQAAFYRQIAQMDQRYTAEVEDRYPQVRCPVQVVWGEQDGWLPPDQGRALAAALPNARLVTVPDAGHLMQEDAPEAILAALTDFAPLVSTFFTAYST